MSGSLSWMLLCDQGCLRTHSYLSSAFKKCWNVEHQIDWAVGFFFSISFSLNHTRFIERLFFKTNTTVRFYFNIVVLDFIPLF